MRSWNIFADVSHDLFVRNKFYFWRKIMKKWIKFVIHKTKGEVEVKKNLSGAQELQKEITFPPKNLFHLR